MGQPVPCAPPGGLRALPGGMGKVTPVFPDPPREVCGCAGPRAPTESSRSRCRLAVGVQGEFGEEPSSNLCEFFFIIFEQLLLLSIFLLFC